MPHIHLIGIGGAGLSAIATVLLQEGYTVSGSDRQASQQTARLEALGATVHSGHRAENLPAMLDAVIVSSAIPATNPEWEAAQQRNIPVMKRNEWFKHMLADKTTIAIAGTHGKTTTTALTAYSLRENGVEPGYIVGGFVPQLDSNAAAGEVFVIEADEYDYMFLGLNPTVALLTNVEWDHPDMFTTPAILQQAFADFVALIPAEGRLVACGDDAGAQAIAREATAPVVTYGLGEANHWRAVNPQPNAHGGYDFTAVGPAQSTPVSLRLPGLHNVYNALGVMAVADYLQLDMAAMASAMGQFTGVGRRFEHKGEVNGITIIDDYAHHPTAVQVTLDATRIRFGERQVWAVFQPHTFSRTIALLDTFTGVFDAADRVIILDIFAAREVDTGQIHSRDLVARLAHPNARHIPTLEAAAAYLVGQLQPGDVLITMGAGDSYRIGDLVLAALKEA